MIKYGIKSAQRQIVDAEINSLMVGQEYDVKKLRGNLESYRIQMGDNLDQNEFNERNLILNKLKDSTKFFKKAYDDQTKAFEQSSGKK